MLRKEKKFELSYTGIQEHNDIGIIYHKQGDYSITLQIINSIPKYSANEEMYYNFHSTFSNIIKVLGEGYTIQKHDILPEKTFLKEKSEDYLENEYFKHFNNRKYKTIITYLTITKNVEKSSFTFKYDKLAFERFLNLSEKVYTLLQQNNFKPKFLNKREVQIFIQRFLSMEFDKDRFSIQNFKVNKDNIEFGNQVLKSVPLIDIEEADVPVNLRPLKHIQLATSFPVDLFSFLYEIPYCQCVIYHQLIQIPNQKKELDKLEAKKKKHNGIPDPKNDFAVEDIENVLKSIAKTNELLVYSHYNFFLYGTEKDVKDAKNYLEPKLFDSGFIPCKRDQNQKELYESLFPGHTHYLRGYNKFFTTSDSSICMLFKESIVMDEKSHFITYFADRQGVPMAIDPSEKPRAEGRINNMNKFVLGPSGSGKSFFMNSFVNQYYRQETDVVIIDTGHSYSGLCDYYGGKYITYSEEKPITMNPFKFEKEELNDEKRTFLNSMIGLIWKGANGDLSELESSVISTIVAKYYFSYFGDENSPIKELSFNSFYEFSCLKMEEEKAENNINIDVDSYKYILKKFYKGGEYDQILNADIDQSLLKEPLIVFEIDNVKDNPTLFPIITVIIMDVFLQKMRHRERKKMLIIEEAWKAIASPMMANYIKYVYKTVRKFEGEAILVTQELDDIIGNDIVKNTVIVNSDTTILLDQAKFKDNFDEIANLLSINEVERRKIFTINSLDNKDNRGRFKEVYIRRGRVGEVYGVEVSQAEYLTFTTERREKEAIKYYKLKYGTYQLALKNFIIDFKKSKLSLTDFFLKVNKSFKEETTKQQQLKSA